MKNLVIISVSASFLGATPTSIYIRGINRNIHPPCLMLVSPGLACKRTGPPQVGSSRLSPFIACSIFTAPYPIPTLCPKQEYHNKW